MRTHWLVCIISVKHCAIIAVKCSCLVCVYSAFTQIDVLNVECFEIDSTLTIIIIFRDATTKMVDEVLMHKAVESFYAVLFLKFVKRF